LNSSTPQHRQFDWELARTTLRRSIETLTGEPSENQIREILDRRARLLAQTPAEDLFREGEVQILSFLSCGETYAIPVEYVRSVMTLSSYTPIPCTPDFVLGAFNVRGQVYPVIDMRRFLSLPVGQDHVYESAILVEASGLHVGLAVDEVFEAAGVLPEDLSPASGARLSIDERCVRGITPELTVILDLSPIMEDPRFVVDEETGFSRRAF